MTEEIINALAKINELKVTSRTSSFFFKNKNIPIGQIGAELNVSTILEGSVRLAGNLVRITAQLIDVEEDFHFFSETFDRAIDNIFAVQDEISLLIADKLREQIGHFEIEDQLVKDHNISTDLYKDYLRGRFHLMKLTLEETEKAISIFKEIIEKQPDFPLPYLDINQGYAFLGTMGQIPSGEAFAKGKPYLDKAIELDENLPQSQLNLSWIAAWQNWDLEKAYHHINQAIDMRPSDEMYLTLANYLTIEGKFEAAHKYLDKALQIDPLSAMNIHYRGFLFYLEEKYEEAIPFLERSLNINPDLPFPHRTWGEALLLMGREKEGLTHFQNLPADVPGSLTKLGGITLAYAFLQEEEKAEAGLNELEKAFENEAMATAIHYSILVHTRLGNHEVAIRFIEQGMEYRLPILLLLYTEPLLKPLRSNSRFQVLMKQALGEKTSFGSTKRKYKKSLLSKELLNQYQRQLEQLIKEDKPYLDPSLTLRSLAEMMGIPPNHLSQLLNEGFDKNFSEYINSYRLETFKEKAADSSQQHLTILALAYDSGFNSKTVFNTFFKKMTGKTPKTYWKEVVK